MELQIYREDGQEAGRTIVLDEAVFGIEPNDHVLWLDVRRIQANGRQGTHKAKERGEVAGSTRKLYRQKGTGHARAGSAKSPLRRSGGRTFGPRPRTYSLSLSKKTIRLARRSALSYKVREEALRVVEDFSFEVPNTRRLAEIVGELGLEGQKVLLLTSGHEPILYRSSRNLMKLEVLEARNASSLDFLGADIVCFQEGALAVLTELLGGEGAVAAPAAVEEVPVEEAPEPEATVEAVPEAAAVEEEEPAKSMDSEDETVELDSAEPEATVEAAPEAAAVEEEEPAESIEAGDETVELDSAELVAAAEEAAAASPADASDETVELDSAELVASAEEAAAASQDADASESEDDEADEPEPTA